MNEKEKHYENCSAPICSCDSNPDYKDEVIWYAGEQVCRHQPYELFQERQIEMNKLVSQGRYDVDRYYTARDLEKLSERKRRKLPNKKAK
jgi:hypothetical protein